jgi:hypothetical protein
MRLLVVGFLLSLLACSSDAGEDADTGLTTTTSSDSTSGSSDELAPFVVRCDPHADDPCAQFGNVACCSDDPAALLLVDGALGDAALPSYLGGAGDGTPIFSGDNNSLSRSGYCLVEETPPALALADVDAQGCRTPCNPTWSATDIATICGPAAQCCQVVEVEPEDCVFDPNLGDSGCFRPATGRDVTGLGGIDATNWGSMAHVTHQDPSGLNCEMFVSALPLADLGLSVPDVLVECYRRLTVANQRGSCFATTELASCPFAGPSYRDACEQMNDDEFRTGCG